MPLIDRSHRLQGLPRRPRLPQPVKLTGAQKAIMIPLILAMQEQPRGLTAQQIASRSGLQIGCVHTALGDLGQRLAAARYPFPLVTDLATPCRWRLDNGIH